MPFEEVEEVVNGKKRATDGIPIASSIYERVGLPVRVSKATKTFRSFMSLPPGMVNPQGYCRVHCG